MWADPPDDPEALLGRASVESDLVVAPCTASPGRYRSCLCQGAVPRRRQARLGGTGQSRRSCPPVIGRVRILVGVADFDLVIFDCDGVLVDSERLAVRTEAEILASLGWPLTQDEIVERFVGRTAAHMQQEIEQQLGRRIDWDTEFELRYREVFERELVAVPGIVEALDEISIPVCVASSGSHDKMRFTLGKTGLFERFDGRIFSVDQVEHGKPAPDIFLFAAAQMGTIPDRCAVVEDSVSGVTAAVSAEMSAFAFAGGVTSSEALSIEGAVVFDDMVELPALLRAQ